MNTKYGIKKQVTREMAGSSHTLAILMSKLRVCLEAAWSMPRVCLEYAYTHLIRNPYAISVRARRTASPLLTDRESAPYGLFLTLLLLISGVVGSWGQTDYSGIYFIANGKQLESPAKYYDKNDPSVNFYLCPAQYYYNPEGSGTDVVSTTNNTGKPFLTTYKTNQGDNSIWVIEKVENKSTYYIKYIGVGDDHDKYVIKNPSLKSNFTSGVDDTRLRVHLEEKAKSELDTDAEFEIVQYGSDDNIYYGIRISTINSGWLNPSKGNKQDYGPNTNAYIGGIIGYYKDKAPNEAGGEGSKWFLEKVPPVISYNSSNLIEISYIDASYTIYYSYGEESTPSPSSEGTFSYSETGPFDPPSGTTTIKAIAIKDGKESGVATFTPTFLLGSTHKYLIQAQGNGWATGNFQGNHYYMIPGDKVGEEPNKITKVNTTSMLRPSMQWYLLNAGVNYYYIVNNVNMTRMRYNTTSGIHMDTWDDNNANEFKFQIVESATAGTYNIIPYGVTTGNMYLNKPGGNADNRNLILYNSATDANSRWKFVPQNTPLADTPPFTTSDANTSVYYKIQNGNGNSHFIIPPTTTNYATASNATDDATVKKMSWYFEKVKDPTDEDWLTYYKVVNAETGKALHYTEIANTSLNVGSYDDGDDNYKFAFVKSPTTNYYYIVPKSVKDEQLAQISMIYRDNNALKKGVTRGNSGNIWTFTLADLFCNDPVFEVEEGVIKIKCNTNAAKIYINTESDTDPTDGSTLYNPTQVTTQNWETNNQVRIKAIAIVNDGTNSASSAVITLLNKPDVTLAGGPYTYKAADWEPSVTLSVGTTQTTTGFSTTYANQKNAGTANVTITDNEASDAWYIWNVPVTEFIIDKAPLTIKANDKTIGYGDEPDNDGVTYNGFVGDPAETESVLGGTLSYSYKTSGDAPHSYIPFDPQYGNQGSYVITPSGLTSTNYDITFSTGVLTVAKKSIGDGALAEGFTLSFDEDGNVILEFGTHTLNKDVDYTIGNEVVGTKYSTRTLSGAGNYDGSVVIRNAIVHFTTDANQTEWSATFVAESSGGTDIGHALPEDIAAYIISDIEGTWAIPEPLEYIPAGVPVLLVTHEAKNGFLVKDANNVTAISEDQIAYNKLKKVTTESAHFNTRQIYVLYNNEFVLNKEGDLENGKVYMDNPQYVAPSPSPAPTNLRIAWGNLTGIETVRGEGLTVNDQSDRWYTLDGRCLIGKPTTKGLYIVNGKKVVIK